MTTLTKSQSRLTVIASALGIVQGMAWFIMSLICIVEYLDSKGTEAVPPSNPSYMDIFNFSVFSYFLHGDSPRVGIITPDGFTVFMWLYLFTDIVWVSVSVLQLRLIRQTASNPTNIMICWAATAFLISCIDFLFVLLLGSEHSVHCLKNQPEAFCINTVIPVLVIVARGFVLWIINVIFVFILYKIIQTIKDGKNLDRKLLSVDTQIPRATLTSPPTKPITDKSTKPITDNNNADSFWSKNPRRVSHGDGQFYPTQEQTVDSRNRYSSQHYHNQQTGDSRAPQSGQYYAAQQAGDSRASQSGHYYPAQHQTGDSRAPQGGHYYPAQQPGDSRAPQSDQYYPAQQAGDIRTSQGGQYYPTQRSPDGRGQQSGQYYPGQQPRYYE